MTTGRAFHLLLGIAVLVTHTWILVHHRTLLPGLVPASTMGKEVNGHLVVVGLPILAASCFLFPGYFKRKFSPLTPVMAEYVFKEPFWYVIGYFLVLVSVGVLFLFSEGPG